MNKATVLFLMAAVVGAAAAPFQNLGFDEANTNRFVIGTYGEVSDILPGWQLSNGIPGPTLVGFKVAPIGLNFATLYDGEGKYALGLYPASDDNGNFAAYHLSQTGDVPVDAKTIRFIDSGKPFELRVNGQVLPLVYEYPLGYYPDRFVSPNPGLFPVLGDISAFAVRRWSWNSSRWEGDLPSITWSTGSIVSSSRRN